MSAGLPWTTYLAGREKPMGTAATRQRAMNLVDRPYVFGSAIITHATTGEEWERRRGTWVKTREPQPRRRP